MKLGLHWPELISLCTHVGRTFDVRTRGARFLISMIFFRFLLYSIASDDENKDTVINIRCCELSLCTFQLFHNDLNIYRFFLFSLFFIPVLFAFHSFFFSPAFTVDFLEIKNQLFYFTFIFIYFRLFFGCTEQLWILFYFFISSWNLLEISYEK